MRRLPISRSRLDSRVVSCCFFDLSLSQSALDGVEASMPQRREGDEPDQARQRRTGEKGRRRRRSRRPPPPLVRRPRNPFFPLLLSSLPRQIRISICGTRCQDQESTEEKQNGERAGPRERESKAHWLSPESRVDDRRWKQRSEKRQKQDGISASPVSRAARLARAAGQGTGGERPRLIGSVPEPL